MLNDQASGMDSNQNTVAGDNSNANTQSPNDNFALKFATLAKQEAKLRSERERFKSLESEASEYNSLRQLAKEDPKRVLEKFGLSVEDLVSRELSSLRDPKEVREEEITSKLSTLEKKLLEREQQEAEQKNQQALQSQLGAIKSLVDTSDEYELISAGGDHDLVWETAVQYYQETGKFVDYSEAAKHVKAHLEEKMDKIAKTKWFQERYLGNKKEQDSSDNPFIIPKAAASGGQTLRNEGNYSKAQADTTDRKELFRRAVELLG